MTHSETVMMVFGSINEDTNIEVKELPVPGQTVLAENSDKCIGGKGANQAIAAALNGAKTFMVGAVGDDSSGKEAQNTLVESNVEIDLLTPESDTPTGRAFIYVQHDGENMIVVDAGANRRARGDSLQQYSGSSPSWSLISLEVPEEQALLFARNAKAVGSKIAVNASPRLETPVDPSLIDALIVNESEVEFIAGSNWNFEKNLADTLGIEAVITTQGARGTKVDVSGQASTHIEAIKVNPVDTTGCGDAFAGVMLSQLCQGADYVDAVKIASIYAGHVAEYSGASASYPQAFATASQQLKNNH